MHSRSSSSSDFSKSSGNSLKLPRISKPSHGRSIGQPGSIAYSQRDGSIKRNHVSSSNIPSKLQSLAVAVDERTATRAGSDASIDIDWNAEKARKWDPWEDGEYNLPHIEPPNEVNFLGGLGPNVGHPRSTEHIQRPTKIQQIYNMRTRNQPVFTFCENPRKANNVVHKKEKIDHRNVRRIRETVDRIRLAQNVETPPPSDFSEDPTEIFDGENPLYLDFQGLDRKETYQRDEQEFQNRREFICQQRHIEKEILKAYTVTSWKNEFRQKTYGVPDYFDIRAQIAEDEEILTEKCLIIEPSWTEKYKVPPVENEPKLKRPIPDAIPFVPPPTILAKLIRTHDKPDNAEKAHMYLKRRKERLEELQRVKNEKNEAKEKEEKLRALKEAEERVINLGEQDFSRYFKDEFKDIQRTFEHLPPIYHEHKYPHTLRETKYLQRLMNRTRRVLRDEQDVRNEFDAKYSPMKRRHYETNHIKADNRSIDASELSEQSTDDEDGMSVGQRSQGKYQLRGFHNKLGDELRGLDDVKPKSKAGRPPRTCITRKEWFNELAQTRRDNNFFKDNKLSIPSKALPTDPDYKLFKPEITEPRPIHVAPIKEMICSVAGEPTIIDAKKPKIKKQKYFKVRKFNLTSYIFGSQRKRKTKAVVLKDGATENKYHVSYEMIDKCDKMFRRKKNRNKAMRHNRMRVLGIPIVQWGKPQPEEDNTEIDVSPSESDNSDWVPAQDECNVGQQHAKTSTVSLAGSRCFLGYNRTQNSVTDMRAPDFREPTLRRHPRRRRKPSLQKIVHDMSGETLVTKYNVTRGMSEYSSKSKSMTVENRSQLQLHVQPTTDSLAPHNENVNTDKRAPFDVPRLSKLASDVILPPNLHELRTKYTDLFVSRHHHPHHDSTQHKTVYVKYLPRLPEFQLPPPKKERAAKIKPFQRAYFKNGEPLREDLSLPAIDLTENQQDDDTDRLDAGNNQDIQNIVKIPQSQPFHSRAATGADHEKTKYLELVRNANQMVVQSMGTADELQEMVIDKDAFVQRLVQEAKSIESCKSSNTSSICTNYTNDSGSFLELQGVKVPCDYVTKAHVPFEEIDRCRVKAASLDLNDEYYGPYYSMPFSGQKINMRKLSLPKDKFFTSSVRSRFGIRNRLQVKVPGFEHDQIGTKERKFISQLATEWDAYYQQEILTRPRVRKFKPRTIMSQAREALRKKFQSNFIEEAIIERAIVTEKERKFAEELEAFRSLCHPLFSQWEETHYRSYMRKMQDIKPFYELTDNLKQEVQLERNKFIRVEMSIIYTEDDLRRRTIMQNFHYLLGDPAWRQQNDWIHRKEDGTLENFSESISKRATTNVRVRDKDSAWAVKEFYEAYFQNENARQVHIVYPDPQSFVNGLLKLKMKSFMCLLELHFAMWVLSNVEHGYNTFKEWSENYVARREKFVKNRCAKKYFSENLVAGLKRKAVELTGEPLQTAVAEPPLRKLTALCDTMFMEMIPPAVRDVTKSDADVIDKFTMIVNAAMFLFGIPVALEQLDMIPRDIRLVAERKVRLKRAFVARQAERACALEYRIKLTAEQMKKNLAPPFKRLPPVHPLPHSVLPVKVEHKQEAHIEITALDKLFYRAFTESAVPQHMEFQNPEDAAILRALEANCIPFYFDYFLRQNNYFPNYDFTTDIEMREGSEFKHFKYEDVLEDVHNNLHIWEVQKQRRIEEHIRQTWHLYADRTT